MWTGVIYQSVFLNCVTDWNRIPDLSNCSYVVLIVVCVLLRYCTVSWYKSSNSVSLCIVVARSHNMHRILTPGWRAELQRKTETVDGGEACGTLPEREIREGTCHGSTLTLLELCWTSHSLAVFFIECFYVYINKSIYVSYKQVFVNLQNVDIYDERMKNLREQVDQKLHHKSVSTVRPLVIHFSVIWCVAYCCCCCGREEEGGDERDVRGQQGKNWWRSWIVC